MMIGSVLSDILLVSSLLKYSSAMLTNLLDSWLLHFYRFFRQLYSNIQPGRSRHLLILDDYHSHDSYCPNGFVLDLFFAKQERNHDKSFDFLARFGWRFAPPLSTVPLLPVHDTSSPLH